ncbi:glycosyltransferase [Rhizobium leguminosarum]|uniref:glycosyltransferase n=1 Tax=Rhizobium leguminosarum TaxID=384 RepID=UPI00143F3A8B|nr:glycosyltransferase [Rhizobium leguminosarum]MBY5840886.1 glycosyltransferase family 1 protein [Rhizobium leguminosarum]MBY5869161.1 glycosyltransferase family 1 protein [Rhizobium leguminosarum]MCA2410876.1 glycosyltransferase [Rhizobium leguminosarum]NKK78016.1 hypothetical protein [Rhizobium leguminosarum bv. viciae]NKL08783.1 hypothetical protein [Rhizobium leguminosarum bv. viciae]
MNILLVTWDSGGNVPPFLSLGSELRLRGHSVSCLGPESLRQSFMHIGARFIPLKQAEFFDPLARLPIEEMELIFSKVSFGLGFAKDLQSVCDGEKWDLILIDFCLASAIIAAESMRVPFGVVSHTIPGLILPFWDANNLSTINALRREFGLDQTPSMADFWARSSGVLVNTIRDLDSIEQRSLPDNVRYVGPIFEPNDRIGSESVPEQPSDGKPEVLVSFSTTFMDQEGPLSSVIKAISTLDVHGLVSCGPAVDLHALPKTHNVAIKRWLPHSQLLQRMSLAVLHGGHCSVTKALSFGVPILSIPLGRDQMYISNRIVDMGLGLTLPKESDHNTIASTISDLLKNAEIRENARRFSEALQKLGPGAKNGADFVESIVMPHSAQ